MFRCECVKREPFQNVYLAGHILIAGKQSTSDLAKKICFKHIWYWKSGAMYYEFTATFTQCLKMLLTFMNG